MENAAKALIIAGGILIAIMTLSLIVYASTSATRIEQARNEKKLAEELAKFNKEYESYHKDRLYGVDVITVMNKAIEHNTKMQASNIGDPYYINIVFLTNEDFKNEIAISVINAGTKDIIREDYDIRESIPYRWRTVDISNPIINNGQKYNLGEFNGHAFILNDFVKNIFIQGYFNDDSFDDPDYINNTITTYTLYSALTNFKRAIFTCNEDEIDNGRNFTPGVSYDETTGRISEMRFMQVGTNNHPAI